jgi:hypothetical protein
MFDQLVNVPASGDVGDLLRGSDGDTEVVERDVVGDPVEPRPGVSHLGAGS